MHSHNFILRIKKIYSLRVSIRRQVIKLHAKVSYLDAIMPNFYSVTFHKCFKNSSLSPTRRLVYFNKGEIVQRSVLIEKIGEESFSAIKIYPENDPAREGSGKMAGLGKVIGWCNSYVSLTIVSVQIPVRVPWNENYNPRALSLSRLLRIYILPLTAIARRFSLKIPSAFTKHRLSIV